MTIKIAISSVFLLGAFSTFITSPAYAEVIALTAHLTSSAELPANDSKGRGDAHFSYNTETQQLAYSLTYDGLSAPASTVDIHGPAGPDANAARVVRFPVPESPISGTATLTSDQAAALLAGRLYVDIHTASHAFGEIRGQIQR